MTEEQQDPDVDTDDLSDIADDVFPEYTGVEEHSTVWVSLEVGIRDRDDVLDPDQVETHLYRFTQEFLEKRLYNRGADDISEEVNIEPAQSGEWSDNELIVKYHARSYFPDRENPKRNFSIFFPSTDGLNWRDLKWFQERYEMTLEEIDPVGHEMEYEIPPISIWASSEKVSEVMSMMGH